jgi:hypothetical protein
MSDKHTPGPWQVTHNSQGETFVDFTGETGGLFAVARVYATGGNQEADARLIAAAPDLLVALRALRDWCNENINGVPLIYGQIMEQADAAIERATDDDRRQQEIKGWSEGL